MPVIMEGVTIVHLHGRADLSATERVLVLQRRLEKVLAKATAAPEVSVEMVDGSPVLRAEDIYLITVTDRDAQHEGLSKTETAVLWRSHIEKGLAKVWRQDSGEYFRGAVVGSSVLVVIGLVLHLFIGAFSRRYFSLPGVVPQFILWLTIAMVILWQFPTTRQLSVYIEKNLAVPLVGVVVVVSVGLLGWLAAMAYTGHFFNSMRELRCKEGAQSHRGVQRLEMARQATHVVVDVVVFVFVVVGLLAVFHINPATLLASAGILGVALGVATQDPAKDLTNGLAVLVEDQFGVGDIIKCSGFEGEVVTFTLRSTQIRTADGSMVTLPNAMVRGVENLSKEWAQVDFRMTIRYERDDIPKALALMERAANELADVFPDMIVDRPAMLGLETLTGDGAVLRMQVKTAPYRQAEARRLLLLHVARLLDEAGIEFPVGRKTPPAAGAGSR